MMSFKEHLLNEKILIDLIRRHDDPMEFAAAAIKAQREKKLNLKRRGMANTRELVRAWDKSKKKQRIREASEEETEREKLPAGTEFMILKQKRRLEKEFPGDAQKQIKTSPQLIQPKLTTGLHGKSIKGTPIKGPPPPSEIESETKSAAKSAGDVLQAIRGIKGRKKKEEQGQTHLFKTT